MNLTKPTATEAEITRDAIKFADSLQSGDRVIILESLRDDVIVIVQPGQEHLFDAFAITNLGEPDAIL